MASDKLATEALVSVDREQRSFRVHRSAYKNPEVFEREKKLIFDKCWLYLGHGSELKKKGDYVTRRIGGRDLIFVRDKNDNYVALYNSCTHRGARIVRETSGNARNFACAYHGWVFSPEGKLMSKNTEEGYQSTLNDDSHLDLLHVARLEQYRNFYFINFNPNAISLHDYLAEARSAIDAICDQSDTQMVVLPGEHTYSIKANYKLLIENSYDGYHLVSVHASYFDFLREKFAGTPAASAVDDTMNSYSSRGAARGLGMGHAVLDSYVPTGRPVAQWMPSMGAALKPEIEAKRARLVERFGQQRADYIADTQKNVVIFPNLVINDIMSITVRYIEPESANFLRVTAWALGPEEETPELRAMRIDNFVSFLGPAGFGSPDDIEMLELCQNGAEHAPIEWSEISKGMAPEGDLRAISGSPVDETQMQAYWTQWDLVMRGIESLEK